MIKRLGIQREEHFFFFLIENVEDVYKILCTSKEYIEAKINKWKSSSFFLTNERDIRELTRDIRSMKQIVDDLLNRS